MNVCFCFLFSRPKIRFDITSKMDSERRAENKQTLQRIDEDRRHLIEATIVRIMKMRKILSNRILIGEVLSQLTPKFTPKIPHIKVSSQWEKISLNFQFRSMHKFPIFFPTHRNALKNSSKKSIWNVIRWKWIRTDTWLKRNQPKKFHGSHVTPFHYRWIY